MRSLKKCAFVFCLIGWGYGIANAVEVSFGVKEGIISQSFSEDPGSEIWPTLSGLAEFEFGGSSFSLRGDLGVGYRSEKAEIIKTTKSDIQVTFGTKYTLKLSTSKMGVYGGEAPVNTGIYGGVAPGMHLYHVKREYPDSIPPTELDVGIGLHLFGGGQYLISGYTLFGEIGWGKIVRENIFLEENTWTQVVFIAGVRF